MTEKPLVSVIIPCYNASKYVEEAVRSIMNQTYKNIEILITDDCSTDNTLEILQQLATEDSRIRVFRNGTNKKIVKTLNKLIENSQGKYIARMDADDISLPERIEKQVAFLELHNDYAFCGTNAVIINENNKELNKTHLPISYEDNKLFLAYYSTFYHPTMMFCADIYKQNLYSEDFLYAEDYELWCRLFFLKKIKGTNLEEYLLRYRTFETQTSIVHHQVQKTLSAKIFNFYDIVVTDKIKIHQNIFFLHEKECYKQHKNKEINYIKDVYNIMSKKNSSSSLLIIQILVSHLIKVHAISTLLTFCYKPLIIKSFIEMLHKKFFS